MGGVLFCNVMQFRATDDSVTLSNIKPRVIQLGAENLRVDGWISLASDIPPAGYPEYVDASLDRV